MSIGPVTGNLSLEVPIVKNKSGLMLAARSTYSDWILKIIDDEKLNNSSVSFYDFIGKYLIYFAKIAMVIFPFFIN